jgi:ribosome-associated heat shock protein Hsp15
LHDGRTDDGAIGPNDIGAQSLRIDRLLFFLRFAKSRSLAQKWVEQGHMRINGARVTHAHQAVRVDDMLTLPTATGARLIQVTALPHRRGPAAEAQDCYCEPLS